jgi:hypothetical protein
MTVGKHQDQTSSYGAGHHQYHQVVDDEGAGVLLYIRQFLIDLTRSVVWLSHLLEKGRVRLCPKASCLRCPSSASFPFLVSCNNFWLPCLTFPAQGRQQ